jgi:peptide chain release factor subunit 1
MQRNEIDTRMLRRLAELKPGHRVLSLFLNLDPMVFATAEARTSAIRSLVDDARRRVEEEPDLSHDEKVGLRTDVARAEAFFAADFSAEGAHGLAVFVCSPTGLFETVKLPRPVDNEVVIDDSPWVEPLVTMVPGGRWAAVLVNRRSMRLLRGSNDGFAEVARFAESADLGGGAKRRDQRSVEHDVDAHFKQAAAALHRHFTRSPFDFLLVGCPEADCSAFESNLHTDLHGRLVGRISVDVEVARPDDVAAAAAEPIEAQERRHERDRLDRLAAGVGSGGLGAAGLDDVLMALFERRVETLLVADGLHVPGVVCPQCGWMGSDGERCPVDESALERREDIVETAIEAALGQSAEVVQVRHHEDLGPLGGIGAVLRF